MAERKSIDAGNKLKLKSIERGEMVMPLIKELSEKKVKDKKVLNETMVNFLKGLPSMIMQNGLGQTIAFLQSKGNNEIIGIFEKMLLPANNKLMDTILNADVKKYLNMQREAIEYAGWMKKFALAFYKKDESEQEAKDADTAAE